MNGHLPTAALLLITISWVAFATVMAGTVYLCVAAVSGHGRPGAAIAGIVTTLGLLLVCTMNTVLVRRRRRR